MEAILLDDITQAVREADEWFKKVGGSSRHWVDDCFMPMLKKQGLDIFKAQEVYDIEAAKAEADAEIERLKSKLRELSNIAHAAHKKSDYYEMIEILKLIEHEANILSL